MFDHGIAVRARSLDDTHEIAALIAGQARVGDVIVLSGEMGSGKTAFAQGFGRALGVNEPITSPTYTLVHSYPVDSIEHGGRLTLHHADLYRLEHTTEVSDLALDELAEYRGIVLVEWGDVVESMFADHLTVHLDVDGGPHGGPDCRMVSIIPSGGRWAKRWARLAEELEPFG